jgi:G6PDH family F420-dependent oxidoreductase
VVLVVHENRGLNPHIADIARRLAVDGFVAVAPEAELVQKFEQAGGKGKPRYGHLTVCWAESEEEAKRVAHENWPNAAIEGPLSQELALPAHFESAAEMVEPDDLAEALPLGPEPQRYLEQINAFEDAGFDHVYIHQVGPDQEGFIGFAQRELMASI